MKSLRAIAFALFVGVVAFGQTFRGGINGVITDESGAVVGSANVKATSQGTGLTYSALSSSAGEFSFAFTPSSP